MNSQSTKKLTRSIIQSMKPYSPGKPIWEVQQELGIESVIKLASNENPLGPSPKAIAAIKGYLDEIHRYPDAHTTKLRGAISKKYKVDENQVIIGNGADELITLISETFIEKGDEIVVPDPSFSEYIFGANLMEANVVKVPLQEGFEYDLQSFLAAITERTKIIYLCSPNNPTGTYITKQDLDRFFEKLPKDIIVVFDSAYWQYATADDYTNGIEYIHSEHSVIVLQTFSKIYGLAGIRVGYGIASEEIIQSIHKVREPFNANALAQVAAEAAIHDDQHLLLSQKTNKEGLTYLYEVFQELEIDYIESNANFVLIDLGEKAHDIYDHLLRMGIIVRYGNVLGLPSYLRITVGTKLENEKLVAGLMELKRNGKL